MDVEALYNLHKEHYEKARYLLSRELLTAMSRSPGRPLNILEIGPGNISILLQSIVDCSKNMDANGPKKSLRIWFIDESVHVTHKQITSHNDQLCFGFNSNEFEEQNLEVIDVKAQFIGSEFNRFLSDYWGGQLAAPELPKFDIIVMHAVMHELYIAAKKAANSYFTGLFLSLYKLLGDDGILFLGDPYYPPYQTTIESHSFIEDLVRDVKHANAPVAFIHPEYLLTLLLRRNGPEHNAHFRLLVDEQMYIRYQKKLNKGRKFYLMILQKVGEAR